MVTIPLVGLGSTGCTPLQVATISTANQNLANSSIKTQMQAQTPNNAWAGRISLQIQSEPIQSFAASFQLKGQPENGELMLISPLGHVLSVLRWSPSETVLDWGNQKIQRFESVDALLSQATGAAVPLNALFAWLQGDQASVNGWQADLSRHHEGRIFAKRTQPAPEANLKIVLDP